MGYSVTRGFSKRGGVKRLKIEEEKQTVNFNPLFKGTVEGILQTFG